MIYTSIKPVKACPGYSVLSTLTSGSSLEVEVKLFEILGRGLGLVVYTTIKYFNYAEELLQIINSVQSHTSNSPLPD